MTTVVYIVLTPNKDNPKAPFIARVDRFFEDTKKKCDRKRVVVDWYLRHEDCLKIRPKLGGTASHDEVFQYSGKTIPRNIDAESIIWKCFVYNFKYRGSAQKRSPNDRHFFCRKQFDEINGKLLYMYYTVTCITVVLQVRKLELFLGYVDVEPISKMKLDWPILKLDSPTAKITSRLLDKTRLAYISKVNL